jgi:putative copper export protein
LTAYWISVTLHVLAAFVWLGGTFFLGIVGAPVLREVEPPELRARLFRRLGERFRTVGWIAVAILILTGLGNLHFLGLLRSETLLDPAFWGTHYGRTLAWKLAAVAAIVAVSALHDLVLGPRASRLTPGSPEAMRARRHAAWLGRAAALIGVAIVILAVRLARGG